jgi:hypothetical protein
MFKRTILSTLLLTACLATWASAEDILSGSFFGDVTYIGVDCDCASYNDYVHVENLDTQEEGNYGIHCSELPRYTAIPIRDWPPGSYKLTVVFFDTDCRVSSIQFVTHGFVDQRVDLIVMGDSENQSGPQGP